jgi:serine/threonine protein kinase
MAKYLGPIPPNMLNSLPKWELDRLAESSRNSIVFSAYLEKVSTFKKTNPKDMTVLDLVTKLLTMDPEKRITASAALKHAFLSMHFVNE